MSLDNIVSVTITNTTPKLSAAGFGTPMVLAYKVPAGWGADVVRIYSTAAAMITDGFTATDPAYLKASFLLQQNPSPKNVVIGRKTASTPDWGVTLTPTDTTEGYIYNIKIGTETFTYIVGASESVTDICDGLRTDIAGATQTITGSGTVTLLIDADTAGDIFSVEFPNLDNSLDLLDRTATTVGTLAQDLAAIQLINDDWYAFIHADGASDADVTALAVYAAANSKFYAAVSSDSDLKESATTDVMSIIAATSNAWVLPCYDMHSHKGLEAALLGKLLPTNPGSQTWAHQTVSGPTAAPSPMLNTTDKVNLGSKGISYYTSFNSISATSYNSGKMSDGEWADVKRGIDWTKTRIQEAIAGQLVAVGKIPFTNDGIALIESEIRGVLELGASRGLYVLSTIAVSFPDANAVSAANKANRNLPDGTFSAQLQGAVHTTTLTGNVYV